MGIQPAGLNVPMILVETLGPRHQSLLSRRLVNSLNTFTRSNIRTTLGRVAPLAPRSFATSTFACTFRVHEDTSACASSYRSHAVNRANLSPRVDRAAVAGRASRVSYSHASSTYLSIAPPSHFCNRNRNPNSSFSRPFHTAKHIMASSSSSEPQSPARLNPRYLEDSHTRIFDNNRKWVAAKVKEDGAFFDKLSSGQSPEYLWIGCSDSRVPANEIMGLEAGEVFVHRNIANVVPSIDLSAMSVVEYAVRHLHVKHIVVCGHYNCGGVKAAMTPTDLGILNPWLRNIRDVYRLYEKELDAIEDEKARYYRLTELNVLESCRNVAKTAVVQQSYAEKGYPIVHGWVFDLQDGLLKDLKVDFEAMLASIKKIYNLSDH